MPNPFPNRQLSYLMPWFEDVSQANMQSLGVTGGFSGAVIWRVSVAGNELCLRRWPQVHPSLTGLLAIHGLLEHTALAGCDIVPVPMVTRYGETHFVHEDHLWELTPWMPGEASLASHPSSEKLVAAMNTLARFHHAAASYRFDASVPHEAPAPGLQERLAIIHNLQQGELEQLWRETRAAQASDLRDLAFELLEGISRTLDPVAKYLEQIVSTPLPLQWCLRDIRHDHLLFTNEQVTGLLDFGAVAIDSVAGDVARLLGSIVNDQPKSWQAGIEAYDAQRALSPAERLAIVGYDQGGLICSATNWVRWLFVEGRSFPQIHALHDQLVWLRDRLQMLATQSAASSADPLSELSGPTWNRPVATPPSASGRPHAKSSHPENNKSSHEVSPWLHS